MPIVRASRLDCELLTAGSWNCFEGDFAFFRRKIYFLSKEKDVFFEGKRSFLVERWPWRPLVGAQIKGQFSILAYEPVDCWNFFSFSRASCPMARKNRFSRTLGCKVSKWKMPTHGMGRWFEHGFGFVTLFTIRQLCLRSLNPVWRRRSLKPWIFGS